VRAAIVRRMDFIEVFIVCFVLGFAGLFNEGNSSQTPGIIELGIIRGKREYKSDMLGREYANAVNWHKYK
jgi:hypothetical protein